MEKDIEIYNYKAVLLSCGFDVEKLKMELDAVENSSDWIERVNGVWHAIPMRSYQGGITPMHISHMGTSLYAPAKDFKDTKWMNHTPYLREIINALGTEIFKIRLMKMTAHSNLHSHVDSFPHHNVVRLHLAIRSDPLVTMTVEDKTWHIKEGDLWFANVKKPHSVQNPSDIDRVHVVFDIAWSDRLEELFTRAKLEPENKIH